MSDDLSKVGMRHDTDCGLLYDDGPEVCTCREISDDLASRMAVLIRRLIAEAEENLLDPELVGYKPGPLLTEARAIVALLPEPVDADREEAKQIAAEWYFKWEPHIDPLTAAIRRGRALERDSREG